MPPLPLRTSVSRFTVSAKLNIVLKSWPLDFGEGGIVSQTWVPLHVLPFEPLLPIGSHSILYLALYRDQVTTQRVI